MNNTYHVTIAEFEPYEPHPVANFLPDMEAAQLAILTESVRHNGLVDDIDMRNAIVTKYALRTAIDLGKLVIVMTNLFDIPPNGRPLAPESAFTILYMTGVMGVTANNPTCFCRLTVFTCLAHGGI